MAGSVTATSLVGRTLVVVPPITSTLQFLNLFRIVRRFARAGTTGELPLLPYVSLALSSLMWALYGIFLKI